MKNITNKILQAQACISNEAVNSAFTNVDLWNIHKMVKGRFSRRYF